MGDLEKHERRDPQSPLYTLIYSSMREIEDVIIEKYQSIRPTQEAQMDALTYAISHLAWSNFEPFLHPDNEPGKGYYEKETQLWQESIDGVRNNDWNPLRKALQDNAQSAFEASALIEEAYESSSIRVTGEKSQKRADAFVNLISSL